MADGRFEGYWEGHLNAWDAVAGLCLVREAGGLTNDWRETGCATATRLWPGAPGIAGFLNATLGTISRCEAR